MQLLGILAACAVVVAVVGLFYYLFDPANIDDEAIEETEDEDIAERARVLAKHREQIEEAKIEEAAEGYSEQ